MTLPRGIDNRLLAALPPADYDLLTPDLDIVALQQDEALSRAGDQTMRAANWVLCHP